MFAYAEVSQNMSHLLISHITMCNKLNFYDHTDYTLLFYTQQFMHNYDWSVFEMYSLLRYFLLELQSCFAICVFTKFKLIFMAISLWIKDASN